MPRVEGAVQLSLPEGSVAVITTRRAGSKGEPIPKTRVQISPEVTEMVQELGNIYKEIRDWDEFFTGGRTRLLPFTQYVMELSDEQFSQLPQIIDQITGEMPAEGRTLGSRTRYPTDFGERLKNFAEEVRTIPRRKKAS